MGRRRSRRSGVAAPRAVAGEAVAASVPFADGQPIRVADLNVDVDDTSVQERLDGPAAESSAGTGRSGRDIIGPADGKSHLQKLEQIVTSDEVWRIVEPAMEAHGEYVASRTAGCAPAYNIMDILVFDAASWLYRTFLGAHNNLWRDPKNWERIKGAAEEKYPDNPHRRLSARAPSRFQHFRARRTFLNGDTLAALRDAYRATVVDTSVEMGMFDPKKSRFDDGTGSFSRPDKCQFMTGDLTWVSAASKHHRSNAVDPRTGKIRRHDPDADYYHSQGKRSASPGRGLVFLTGRNPYPNERLIFDHAFTPRKDDPAFQGRNDGDLCTDMYIDSLDTHEVLDQRVHGLVYDGAADSEAVDRILDRGKHAVVPTRKTSKGKHAAANLGAYNFKTKDGAISRHTVIAIAGTATVVLTDGDGEDFYVPLDCTQRKPVARKDRHTIYGRFEMPDLAVVPQRLVGAHALIPINSTQAERDAKPHTRRSRALRTIAPSDPRCARIRGLRPDSESLNRHVKNLLPSNPPRLRTSQDDDSNLNILTYCILQLTAAKAAYDERTARASGETPTPRQPRAGPGSPLRLPAGDEPVPKAA